MDFDFVQTVSFSVGAGFATGIIIYFASYSIGQLVKLFKALTS